MRGLALLALPALIASAFVGPHTPARALGYSILVAEPFEGHSGDWIYLTGYGLPPKQHLDITMACPSWHDNRAAEFGNVKLEVNGPQTNANGYLKPYRFKVLTLHQIPASGCQIYVQVGANPFGPDFPALFTVLPPSQRVDLCARRICLSVKAKPARVHAGSMESIDIQGYKKGPWPGATADVTVTYPDGKQQRASATLDITGSAQVHLRAGPGVGPTTAATVSVRAHLGGIKGQRTGQFTVVR